MNAIESTLVYLVAGLLGYVVAQSYWLSRHAANKLLKVLGWIQGVWLAVKKRRAAEGERKE